ncbi:peptide deformylase [Streptomyces salinarius]|uniref:peptide deformylase n=1 Tax=Streptomyces salinarius TaxID=2762598 RepID=UPI0021BD8F3D|nr:peptide deformylase [Streptomyces salinarius]
MSGNATLAAELTPGPHDRHPERRTPSYVHCNRGWPCEHDDYERGLARLVQHEIDHLDGHLYTARMRPGVQPISVTEYRQTGRAWSYEH